MLRFFTLMPIGAVLLLCVLWLMENLIKPQKLPIQNPDTLTSVDFLRTIPVLKDQAKAEKRKKEITKQKIKPKTPPRQTASIPTIDIPAQKFDVTLPMQQISELAVNVPSSLVDLAHSDLSTLNSAKFQDSNYSTNIIPLQQIHPIYPPKARRQSIEGWVKVGFIITTEGTVSNVRLIDSAPPRVFDRAAIKAISRWKFSPQLIAGIPQQRAAEQKLVFGLN
ncbi:MAG: protein TonB [Pseudohongiellaceae bacterium]|jgi:protein TonB